MTQVENPTDLLSRLDRLNVQELRRLLVEHLTKRKLGLTWERNAIEHDDALNADVVLPQLVPELSHRPAKARRQFVHRNLIIEGDNFDSLRLLKATHAGRVRVIYIDPPYNTGEKDWVYNDNYIGKTDRWRHSVWLEFLYQRLLLARELLTPDGVIMVSIADDNRARLDMLMSEVFPGGRLGSFVWKVRNGGNDTKGALMSINHEHVLVYGNPEFEFKGEGRDESQYTNPDNDARGPWNNDNLVKAHNAKQRPEAYYHIQNPETGIWYLCDPDSVWRFSSTTRPLKKKLQADPIEVIIEEKRVLWPGNDAVAEYGSVDELKAAIKAGKAPKQFKIYSQLKELAKLAESDDKVERLLSYIPPIEFWVGKRVGYGKPRYKRFREQLKRDVTPLSSWLQPAADGDDEEADGIELVVGATGEGTALYKQILNNKDFPYPKPLSLIKGLLSQATKKNDIVLDFFAGSGTIGHAVLELNAEDGGMRRYILCSSTEATKAEPKKNICRDITAERMRRVSQGYAGKSGYAAEQGGEFAYLQLDKLAPADLSFEVKAENAVALLSLRLAHAVWETQGELIQHIARADNCDILLCMDVNTRALKELVAWPLANGVQRLAVYCERPLALQEALEAKGIDANCYSLVDALINGQVGTRA
jgi:adenine-specific DNA-methyltransferase